MSNLINLLDTYKGEKRELYPLTPSQMGVYLSCMHNPKGTMYNIPCTYVFDSGSLDTDRLINAVRKTVDNHPVMKIFIDSSTGSPMMKPRDSVKFDIPVVQVDNLEQAGKDFVKPFELEKDILFRFAIFECGDKSMFAMDFHHIISDGTSVSVICNDIALAYDGKELEPEKISQLNLSVFEEKLEETEEYQKSKNYYDSIFSAVESKSEITEDFAENSEVEDKPNGSFELSTKGKFSVEDVRNFALANQITPYTVFLGAYEYAVAKFTNQSETTVCTVTHGRFDKQLKNTVGMMVRTLPIHANIDEEDTVSDYLKKIRRNIKETVANDWFPFMKLASAYDLSADIMLAYQADIFNTFKIGGQALKLKLVPLKSAISKLNVMVFESETDFELRFEYRNDLFKEETIRSFADSFLKIVEQFLKKSKLCEVELVNENQLAELDNFNKTEFPFDDSKTVVDLFEEQCKKTPDKTAVVYKEKKFTYAEIDEITDRIAGYVHSKGIGKEEVVSILIPRCEYMPIASIGVLKSGAAYQPLDPSYPPERLQFMIKDANAKLLIADENLLELLPDYSGDILLTKDIPNLPKSDAVFAKPSPDDLFILIYTSGSTGTPKGAMLEHKNVRSFCDFHIRNSDIDEHSVVSAYASYGFDACLSEMYPALIGGAELHIIEEDIRLDLIRLNRYFEDNGITHAFMTTQVARQFATEIDNHSLKYLLTGGERLVPLEPPKNFELINGYGPTECTVYITTQPVDKLYHRIPVGKALDNIKLYVTDKYGRRLPTGALGELCVSGQQVSRGYLNRPEQTAKAYEKNPYCNENGYERLYHTGDIVRLTDEGKVDFIGRNDGQVKIRGFRIELSEVDKIIRKYDGITNTAVIARKLDGGGQCINAYIVADRKIDIQKLNEFILEHKPPYMVPAATMQIDKIPLNVNGKVDKRKLPEIKAESSKKKNSAPRELTFLEKKISAIIERIIGHSDFDISENLINAGMTSLSVIKLAVELNKAFGFEAQVEMNTAKFKTAVHIEDYKGKPSVVVQYNDALYSGELMRTLAKSVLCAVEHIIENPNGKIRKVSLLDNAAIAQLESFKSTEIAPVKIKLLHKMFEEQVAKTPDRIALSACDGKLTYKELDRLANITANSLIEKGLEKDGKVLILLERTSKFFTSLLGILKAGGAFIPSCPDYPKERIDSIIEDSDADFVITEGELLGVYDRTVDVSKLLSGNNEENPNVDVQPDDLAYLIYTSGSTGKPKGVMLRHIGIANYLAYSDSNIQVKEVVDNCHAYGSVTTISFDMSLKETMLSLCNGLTLVFASDEQTVNPLSLAEFFKENNVDAFNSTPSRLLQYMELDEFAEAMANCKVILSGGEKYPDKLLRVLREKTNAIIINTYGPTEITVSSNAKNLTNTDEISIGRPLRNYTEYIVDSDNNLLPIGVVGELLIQGYGVALGYNKLPEQTAKAFIEFNGERTYRSGDYAKWTTDGDVIILGRTDNQVKLRGLRIELGEIEKCLTAVDGIKSGIALIRKVGKADAICVYYTADRQIEPNEIKSELAKSLTDYMVPSAYVQLDEMPLTPNGKVNTKVLPEPKSNKSESGRLPKNEIEKTFCDIFAEILELDNVFADDNFFDLGGTSLTATRIVISASKKNIEVAYSDIFANPTPQTLAKFVSKDGSAEDDLENLSDYDYTNINKVLEKNNIDTFKNGELQKLGNVLLTGSAGFLGVHILYELLHKYNGKVYCMIRDKNNNPAENRMNSIYYYYFEESLKERYPDRVTVISGDVTNRESFDKFIDKDINTVINCAANVKHFSKGTDIEDVNLYGTLNVLDFCKKANARLVHVSTMSVGGMFVGEQGSVDKLKENQLYFGQHEGSKYTLSKFLAERAILEEVSKGFNAKIMRVGTLAARNSDGEYQINFTTNTFMGRLKSTLLIGKYPYEAMEMPFELSPIDFVAKAILLLAQAPKDCTVFHPFNNHTLIMGDLYTEMNKIGLHSQGAEYEEYMIALDRAEQDPEKAKILSSMIAYQNMAHGQKTFTVGKSNTYTMQVLYRMGFVWPVTSLDYMKRFINALRGLGFFD